MRTIKLLSFGLVAILAAACSSTGSSPSLTPSSAPSAAVASTAPSVAPSVAPSATPDACAAANLTLITAGKLTIGTDNPAFPPYYQPDASGAPTTAPWALGDPTNGQGFESAVAYAIAKQLGFSNDQVVWVYVPFDNSFKPGAKAFDFDINQISFTAERAQAVDMTDGYYFVNQAVVAFSANPISKVTSISGLKPFRFGAQVGTTSYSTITDVIKPTPEAKVYDTTDVAIAALKAKQIDGIVVDLPTAFYMAAAQLDGAQVVGQFALPTASAADLEHFSLVLAKGSSLTPCLNGAIGAMKADGSLDALTKEWLSDKAAAPVFTP
jgi:polar amino acid transport system substrate-binding protein